MRFKNLDKYTKLAIIIILVGTVIRFSLAAMHHVSGDACWQLSNAIYLAENNEFPLFKFFGRDEPFWAPPFFHLIIAAVYGIFVPISKAFADFAIKMVSPLFGSLTLIIFFLMAKMLFSKKIALYSLLFMAFIPLHIDYSIFSYVDSTITFLAVLSVYFALKNMVILSAIAAGLTMLTKYNGFFILPVLLFIIYKNYKGKKDLLKNVLIISIVPALIGSIWFIRNWIYLGNPVWPFMNSIFSGYEAKTFVDLGTGYLNFGKIFSISGLESFYYGIFGVPDGNISTLSFIQLPNLSVLFAIWLISTFIFLVPLVMGIASKKLSYKSLLYVWIGSFVLLLLLYVINSSWSVTRFMLPAFPAIALIWAHGLEKIRHGKIRNALIAALFLIILGFVFTSFVKISIAASSWNSYKGDFEWVKSNTEKNSIFIVSGQCISYNIERQTLSPEIVNFEDADYVWVNQNFRLESMSILGQEFLDELDKRNAKLVYDNKKTKTRIYEVR